MSEIVALAAASDLARFGGKAVQLGAAIRAGLPTPPGVALSCAGAAAVVGGDAEARRQLLDFIDSEQTFAVRSSAIGEDSAGASFAGTHRSILGVRGHDAVFAAIGEVLESGADPGARAYRERMGLAESGMAVVVQELIDADVAGVMFTLNPVSGADERIIEASWGLGEVVVSGLVTPDRYVINASGQPQEVRVGEKDVAIRLHRNGGIEEVQISGVLVDQKCLGEPELFELHKLALACDAVFGSHSHDIEFAFRGWELFLLQRRPITHG